MVDVRRGAAHRLAAALLLLAGSTACSEAGDASAGERTAQEPTPSAPTSTAPYDPLPWTVIDGPLGRCGPVPQRVADQTFTPHTVRDPGTARLPAVTA